MYPHVCASVEGLIQQLATSCIANGYFFYVLGQVPEGKDPARVDAKLIDRYGIDISKWTRARRKRAGQANIQYLRFGRLFVLLATHGEHVFFREEGDRVRDVRRVPLKACGYALTFRRGHTEVRIEREEFKLLSAHLLNEATHRNARGVADGFTRLPYEPYAPVRKQLLGLWRTVNRARRAAGFQEVTVECIRVHRRIVRPFTGSGQVTEDRGNARGAFSESACPTECGLSGVRTATTALGAANPRVDPNGP
jgi:hypothetical protein